jgi:hypothetical protein
MVSPQHSRHTAGGPVTMEASELIHRLKNADIIVVNWPRPGTGEMQQAVFGVRPANQDTAIELTVATELQVAAIQEAKRALVEDDEERAYRMLSELASDQNPLH